MLARRFTIVCLIVTIFGMSLSILVAEKSRSDPIRTHAIGCDGVSALRCALPSGR